MAYIEATLIVDGALDEEKEFPDYTALNNWVDQLEGEHEKGVWEVFVIEHEHETGIECECVQYLTDHSPYTTIE